MAGFNLKIDEVLKSLGVNAETFDRLRLGRGVVGRITYVAIAVLAVLAVAAHQTQATNLLIGVIVIAALLFLIYLFSMLRFARNNPGAALLDGAELLMWRRLDMAAKGMPNPPTTPAVTEPDPERLPPPAADSESES